MALISQSYKLKLFVLVIALSLTIVHATPRLAYSPTSEHAKTKRLNSADQLPTNSSTADLLAKASSNFSLDTAHIPLNQSSQITVDSSKSTASKALLTDPLYPGPEIPIPSESQLIKPSSAINSTLLTATNLLPPANANFSSNINHAVNASNLTSTSLHSGSDAPKDNPTSGLPTQTSTAPLVMPTPSPINTTAAALPPSPTQPITQVVEVVYASPTTSTALVYATGSPEPTEKSSSSTISLAYAYSPSLISTLLGLGSSFFFLTS